MKKYLGLVLMTLIGLSLPRLSAQSAVAVGSNGVYGYAYREESQGAAVFHALQACRAAGGVNIHIVSSTFSPGFGAVAYWSGPGGRWVIGCSLGMANRYEAIRRSIDECLMRGAFDPRIVAQWVD